MRSNSKIINHADHDNCQFFSTGGGAILDKAVEHFSGITVFAPVMNGAGGNLVAIQVRLFHCGPIIKLTSP